MKGMLPVSHVPVKKSGVWVIEIKDMSTAGQQQASAIDKWGAK
jgi:hypothetical protein